KSRSRLVRNERTKSSAATNAPMAVAPDTKPPSSTSRPRGSRGLHHEPVHEHADAHERSRAPPDEEGLPRHEPPIHRAQRGLPRPQEGAQQQHRAAEAGQRTERVDRLSHRPPPS